MRKKLLLLACIFCIMSNSKAQYLGDRIDLGITSGIQIPLNFKYVTGEEGFRYPSLFGNYSPAITYGGFSEYQINSFIRIKLSIHHVSFNSWKGDENVFILEDPLLSLTTLSLGGLFIPQNRQWHIDRLTWGIGFYPSMVYQDVTWNNFALVNDNSMIEPYRAIKFGFKTGASCIYEINHDLGLRIDLNYEFKNVDSYYFLDRSFHSLNATISFFIKLLKNRNFRYD